jgi:hypothetical protein
MRSRPSPEKVFGSIPKLCWTVFVLLLVLLILIHPAGMVLAQNQGGNQGKNKQGGGGKVAPEVDPSSLAGAIALVSFGTVVLIGWRRRK